MIAESGAYRIRANPDLPLIRTLSPEASVRVWSGKVPISVIVVWVDDRDMSQETNEFENGPTGDADSDSIQSPQPPESQPPESQVPESPDPSAMATTTTTIDDEGLPFEDFKPESGQEAQSDYTAAPPPVAGPRRLVRDPYSRLGGVASGVAHYYGVDVVLVRLLFIAFVLFTGFGILLYFLAWLLIPRAEYWPPTPPKGGTRAGLDNRQIALGLVGFGVLVAAFASGGSGSQVVIALGLIGAGVWMFTQNPAPDGHASALGPVPGPVGDSVSTDPVSTGRVATDGHQDDRDGDDGTFVSAHSGGAGSPPITPPPVGGEPVGYPAPQPVPRRRRRIWPFIVFPLLFIIVPVLVIGSILAIVVAGDGEFQTATWEIASDGTNGALEIRASSVDDLLEPIGQSIGGVTLDLTDLEAEDFADYDTPIKVEIDNDLGEIEILLPEDLDVRVEADVDLGEIKALGRSADGISPSMRVGEGEPLVEFDLDLDIGSINVRRVEG